MDTNEKLNYVEFSAKDLQATKLFFKSVFGWDFVDYGSDYTSFSDQGLNGGFFKGESFNQTSKGGALLVFYSKDIQSTYRKITMNGGIVTKDIFDFPGGCRFHFNEPSGNEFAVWSEIK